MSHLRFLISAGALLAGTGALHALEWQTKFAEVRTKPFQPTVEISFPFKNTNTRAVTIRDVQTNCDCVEAKADRSLYQPGEEGAIHLRFAVGDRYGLYERTISVVSDDVTEPTRLKVRIEVPDLATVTPRTLYWTIGGATNTQTIELRAADGLQVDFTQAEPTDENFQVKIEPVEANRVYRLRVTPATTKNPSGGAIRIYGRDKEGHAVLVSAYLNVQ